MAKARASRAKVETIRMLRVVCKRVRMAWRSVNEDFSPMSVRLLPMERMRSSSKVFSATSRRGGMVMLYRCRRSIES